MPRKTFKDEANLSRILSTRVSERMWFGMCMVTRARGEPLSVTTKRLIKHVFEGNMAAIADFHVEGLNEIFHEVPWTRLERLAASRPELLTAPERQALKIVQDAGTEMCRVRWDELQLKWGLSREAWG